MLETFWSELLDIKDPLFNTRKKAWEQFEEIGLPRSKEEAFQYLKKELSYPKPAEKKILDLQPRDGFVFIDGYFDDTLSRLPKGIISMPIEKAIKSYGLFLQSRMAKIIKQETDPFAALNGAFQGAGAFLYVPPNCKCVLQLTQIYTSEDMASPRLHIYLGRNAHLEIEEISQGTGGFTNTLIDFVLDEGAHLKLIDRSVGDFQAIRGLVKKDAHFKTVSLANVLRTSLKVQLAEEGGNAELYGLASLDGDAQRHFHAIVEHIAPNTTSRQHFKSVLNDRARFSFEGKIYVHPEAQKTAAYQLNNNLILSDEASANAKPNLEIFADDVKASHGATVGRLDEEELFYLRSRGLDLEQARKRLIQGYLKEVLDHA